MDETTINDPRLLRVRCLELAIELMTGLKGALCDGPDGEDIGVLGAAKKFEAFVKGAS